MNISNNHRAVEAILFASSDPVKESYLQSRFSKEINIQNILSDLQALYKNRGVVLKEYDGFWVFQTAPDLANYLEDFRNIKRKLSKAAMETLSIIAYHQPITRPEIEEIRGVNVHSGTLDILFESGWIEPKGKKEVPGRPSFWRTTKYFLHYFDLKSINELPSLRELKESGLLSKEDSLNSYLKIKKEDS